MTETRSCVASLVALPALPAVSDRFAGPIGGTETRAWTLARGLARFPLGVTPRLIVRGRPSDVDRQIDGVEIAAKHEPLYQWYVNVGRCVTRAAGFQPFRITRFDPTLLWQLPVVAAHRMFRSRPKDPRHPERFYCEDSADILLAFGVQSTAATVVASAHATDRPAVVLLGCDDDLNPRYVSEPDFINPYGDSAVVCRWILERADTVVVQTEWQQQTLLERFGRAGVLLRNPIDLEIWSPNVNAARGDAFASLPNEFVLWVGRAEGIHKRPQDLIPIAECCPELPFVMVMNPADAAVEAEVRSNVPPNVVVVDHVPPTSMPELFARSAALVNTSAAEGFPNTFLQAAATKTPVYSLNVLGDFLVDSGIGRAFNGDAEKLAGALRNRRPGNASSPTASPSAAATAESRNQDADSDRPRYDSESAYSYVQAHHDLERICHQFAEIIASTAARHRKSDGVVR